MSIIAYSLLNKYAYIVSVDGKALSKKYNVLGLKKGSFRVDKCDVGKDVDTNNTKEDGIDKNNSKQIRKLMQANTFSSNLLVFDMPLQHLIWFF